MKTIILLCGLICSASLGFANYCNMDCGGQKHIGCNNNGKVNAKCAATANLMNLSGLKNEIVNLHNKLRNQVASGKFSPFKSAARMATITWDDELAYLASLNVMTCEFKHDRCRNTQQFPYAGQNLATFTSSSAEPQDILNSIQSWFNEYTIASNQIIQKFSPSPNPMKAWGHFTQMVNDKSYKVGCAALKMKLNNGYFKVLIACDYALTNMRELPVYEFGAPASKCQSGKNRDYPNLCSVSEKYQVTF